MEAKKELYQMVETSQQYPVFFVERVLGESPWAKQNAILKSVNKKDTTVASCHGAGKSFIAARIVVRAMSVFPGTQVITTAPTNRQVKSVLWKEIRLAHNNARINLGGKPLTQEIQVDDDWFAIGFATNNTDQFQGFHGERILVVVDEAAGVDEEIFDGIDGITSGANSRRLYIGNPSSKQGRFYESHQDSSFNHFNISVFDTPNFTTYGIKYKDIANGNWEQKLLKAFNIDSNKLTQEIWENEIQNKLPFPKLVTPKWARERYERWGPDSALFQAKVWGKFPEDEEFTIIPLYLWKGAQKKEKEIEVDSIYDCGVGIDVARFGDDNSCIAIHVNDELLILESIGKMDSTEVTEWADRIIRDNFKTIKNWKDIPINVDVIGYGSGVKDQLQNIKGYTNVNGLDVSEKAKKESRFINKRAEMYWEARDGLKDGKYTTQIHSEDLENQITSIRYEFSNGRVKLEKKDKIKKRLKKSPDEADAVCMCWYHDEGSEGGFLSAWGN